ncbi:MULTISPECIES: hypothetical protein [unclassified Novosphingobium]|uniref:hypothetical protein n=1 Tax=unclassified Novosphingobium TaxID=2644732 RepID=UPI00146F66DD|nr:MULTISPECIES: hypothetical protein [unclassified Novosphingobium]NMN06882.1 hypothetical protein [Novosphingobium sp. SG919]NMN89531.1 hypothetical protein [Novosphingobium sp. SG916]
MLAYFKRVGLALGGVIGAVLTGIALESYVGIPFATTYRIACAVACLVLIFKLGKDYPGERWPRPAFFICLIVNVLLFFTPIMDRRPSRGELMIFALPDVIIVLMILIASKKAVDVHQRAVRQQMILGLIVALLFCSVLYSLIIFYPDR